MTWKIGAMVDPSTRSLLIVLPANKGQNLRAYFLYKLGMYLGQHYTGDTLSFNFCNKVSRNIRNNTMRTIWGDEVGYTITPSHNNVLISTANYRNPSDNHAMGWLQETARNITNFVLDRMPPPTSETAEEQPVQEESVVEEPSVPVVPEGVTDTHWETEPELPDHVWNNDAIPPEE